MEGILKLLCFFKKAVATEWLGETTKRTKIKSSDYTDCIEELDGVTVRCAVLKKTSKKMSD